MNEKQIEAVKSMENTLLIAGAGTGKTFTIINKIDYILKNRIYKENELLVISFTNETVNDIKNKINYNVDVKTFHKLAIDLLHTENTFIANPNLLSFIIDEYLLSYGKYNKKTNIIIKRILKESNPTALKNLIITFINLYKSNYTDINLIFELYQKNHFINKHYLKIILDIYTIYQNELNSSGQLDFNDMITQATNQIKENKIKTNYKYIIIDEFQDTSLIRFNLIYAILKQNNGKIFAVGDDYQSIYRFSGCDLNIFINFKKFVQDLKIINLDYNYRNNQSLIYVANEFIMKNKNQLIKQTICLKDANKPIKIIFYTNKKTIFSKIRNQITGKITVLGRNNKDKSDYNITEDDETKFLTIHKSKGLEDENIILVNLENNSTGLPSKIKNHDIIKFIINTDIYPYEEERRLFYVALTRTKNNIYLLTPSFNYSVFIKEIIKDYNKFIEILKY
jgi:DNA helicase-4